MVAFNTIPARHLKASLLWPGATGRRFPRRAESAHGERQRSLCGPRHHGARQPEIAALPDWVIALVAAGSLAAALSTAAGLLLVISTSVSHDLMKKTFAKGLTDRQELFYARLAAVTAIGIAGYLGIDPPGFVAQVVAFAFDWPLPRCSRRFCLVFLTSG